MPSISQLSGGSPRQAHAGSIAGKSQPVVGPTPRAAPRKKPPAHHGFWGNLIPRTPEDIIRDVALAPTGFGAVNIIARAAAKSGYKPARVVGQIAAPLSQAPYDIIRHPYSTTKDLGSMAVGLTEGYFYALPKALSSKPGFHGVAPTAKALAKGIVKDYKTRYGKGWEAQAAKHPFYNFSDLLMVAGAAGKAGSISAKLVDLGRSSLIAKGAIEAAPEARAAAQAGQARILEETGKPWEKLNTAQKAKLARKESRAPGVYTRGQRDVRNLKVQIGPANAARPEGSWISSEQALSGSPLRRTIQQGGDALSQAFPNMRVLGATGRINRATARQLARVTDRALSSVVDTASLKGLPQEALTRAFWEANLVKHDVANGKLAFDHAATTKKLEDMRAALQHEYSHNVPHAADNPELSQWLYKAKQAGFGPALIKRLDAAIKYQPNAKYERAIGALHNATSVAEGIMGDTAGFSPLRNEQQRIWDQLQMLTETGPDGQPVLHPSPSGDVMPRIAAEHSARAQDLFAQLDRVSQQLAQKGEDMSQIMYNRRGRVSDWLNSAPVQAPERAAWESALVNDLGWTDQQASDAMVLSDLKARALRPNDPASFYSDMMGSPSGMTPAEVQAHANTLFQNFPESGVSMLIEGPAHAPAGTSQFYSQLQKNVAEKWGKRPLRPAAEVESQIRANVSKNEWDNSGLDQFFAEHAGEQISQEQLHTHLATPLNVYNIREVHRINTPAAEMGGTHTIFNGYPGETSTLLAREPGLGQYHEIHFELAQTPPGAEDYLGTGAGHWQQHANVVGHVRFHIYDEGGVKTMLIDEVQFDWAADARKGLDVPRLPMNQDRVLQLAINRALLEAGTKGVNRVVIVDGSVQAVRNGIGEVGGVGPTKQVVSWGKEVPGEPNAAVRQAYLNAGLDAHPRSILYNKDAPKAVTRRIGVKGEHSDAAFQGRYVPQGSWGEGSTSLHGDMPGTVFNLDDAARARATEPSPLYQKQPEWGKVPRGANELLADGSKRLIHMFKTADISTWVHELAHSGIHDLAEGDQAILNSHYGAGAEGVADWTTASHENYARDFERFVRTGDLSFLPRPVAEVFQRIQEWMQRVYRVAKAEKPGEIPPHVEDVFKRMLAPSQDVPDIFMPHRAGAPDLAGGRMTQGIPRASRALNADVASRIPLMAPNRLGLLRGGLIHDDPRLLFEHVNRLISLQKANQIREYLLTKATPLRVGDTPDFKTQYVIKTTGTNPNKVLWDAVESAQSPEEVSNAIKKFIDDNVASNPTELAKLKEGWTGDQQLYTIDKHTTDDLFRNITGQRPGAPTRMPSGVARVVDTSLNTVRSILLYANPGFYTANLGGNFGMMMFNDPRALKYLVGSMKDALVSSEVGLPHSKKFSTAGREVSPVFQRVANEMGRGPTSGGLRMPPSILGREAGFRAKGVGMRMVERWDYRMSRIGHGAGAIVDDAFRVATWRQEASKLGHKTDKQVLDLLDQAAADARAGKMAADSKAIRDVNAIRDKAEQLMLDFDSMTPFEKDVLTRIIFLYPFLKASFKYPAMYAGEHPITAGAAIQASNIGQQFADQTIGPRPNLPIWARGYARTPFGMVNIGSIDQMNVLAGELESAMGVGTATQVGINRPGNFLNPLTQVALELAFSRNRYGREANAGNILRTDFPVPAYISALYRQPSALYSDPSFVGALKRSSRLIPFKVNPDYGTGQSGG